ncbi:MAG: exported protein of unknown function [Candidatus Saccharibacteria bacterium]|nr:exported protein of unknown function [Candidatus Saccharibacteria bacterium]
MNIFKHLPKQAVAVLSAIVIMVGLSSPAMAAFGPDRPTKAWSPTVSGFDHVTFNSFTGVGNGVGDERDFMRGIQVGRDSTWTDPVKNVSQDAEVEAKIYIHNNADATLNDAPGNPGVAKNVTVRVALPSGAKQTQEATAFIKADNAQPGTVTDTLTMTGANNGFFQLAYENGTAQVHDQSGHVTALTAAQEQALTGTGWNMGDQKGCFAFVKEITFKMRVQMPEHSISKQVALPGQTAKDWTEKVNVKQGDTVSWLVTFRNAGKTELDHIKIVDDIPVGLTVVPGTVKLTNGNYPNGYVYADKDVVQANGRQLNIDIGNYLPGGAAYISYRTTIDKTAEPVCKPMALVNKAFATPAGYGAVWDVAEADVAAQSCATTPPATPVTTTSLPNTGAGNVVAIFAATTAAGAVAYRWFVGRRLSRR